MFLLIFFSKRFLPLVSLAGGFVLASQVWAADKPPPAPNGIERPEGYQDWRPIGVSHRSDKNSLRIIVGNDIAVQAARAGKTNPWPDGTILGKLVWEDRVHENWAAATVPGKLVHTEFMIRDARKYAGTKGWGFARWLGDEQKPYGKDATFANECAECHTAAKDTDHVFTRPVSLP
jgi:hypothetical protein